MLEITSLSVSIDNTQIIKNFSASFSANNVYALMGPNGSGKSTLTHAIVGNPKYNVTQGKIIFYNTDYKDMPVDERVRQGLFVAFQNSPVIPGVTVIDFFKEMYRACVDQDIDILTLADKAAHALKMVGLHPSFLYRSLNDGFSGGEKKRFEIAQLLLIKPKVVILDEIDSGLDIDAIKQIAAALHEAKKNNPEMCIVLITHYQRILRFITPDIVHVLKDGCIAATGDYTLAEHVEKNGYDEFEQYERRL